MIQQWNCNNNMIQAALAAPEVENDHEAVPLQSSDAQVVQCDDARELEATTEEESWTVQSSLAFSCLYTKQKTQKRKIWHDGRLLLLSCRAVLYDANPIPGSEATPLGECELNTSQRNDILHKRETCLDFELFLVELQGLWSMESKKVTSSLIPARSKGMQKVLTKRFQKPGAFVPPDPLQTQPPDSVLGKRRRPLQPGELQQKYYGNRTCSSAKAATATFVPSAWNQPMALQPHAWIQPVDRSESQPRTNQNIANNRRVSPETPFVRGNQIQDSEEWSPRRPNKDTSPQETNRGNLRSTSTSAEQNFCSAHQSLPRHSSQIPRSLMDKSDSLSSERPFGEFQNELPGSNKYVSNRHIQFYEKNGFDPNHFFGEEEEEEQSEDDQDDEALFRQENVRFPDRKASGMTKGSSSNSTTNSNGTNNYIGNQQKNGSQASALTRDELLQLFATSSPPKPLPKIQEAVACEQKLEPKPREECLFELPSASDSSSDDESAEND